MIYILIYIGVFVALIIVLTLWGKFDPKVKVENAKYEKSLEGKSSNKKTIHRSLDNTEVRTIMKKTEKTYHENGNIHIESELNEKGEEHGIKRIYHENGQLQAEVNYTNGIQDDGITISYHDNGIKSRQVILLNGEFNGEFSEWHENGQLKRKSFYEDGLITGVYKTWDSFGNLKNNFFKHKFIDTIDCEKFHSYKRGQKKVEEIEVNWLQDIGPIYKRFTDKNEVSSTLQHTIDDEDECIFVFSHNEEDAKSIIDTIIENNGGILYFESFEYEDWHYSYSGYLFNISYKTIIPDKLYVVELNRYAKNNIVSFNNSEVLYGIHKDSKKLNNLIEGLDSIVYNWGEITSGSGAFCFTANNSHIVSYWSDPKEALNKFKEIEANYLETQNNVMDDKKTLKENLIEDVMNGGFKSYMVKFEKTLKNLKEDSTFGLEIENKKFRVSLSKGTSSYQMNIYLT